MAQGVLRVVSEGELQTREAEEAARAAEMQEEDSSFLESRLANHIRQKWDRFKRHRTSEGITDRHLDSLRTFNGQYSPAKLREIEKFGGSTVFARITSVKCRGATALLRDVFLTPKRPWGIDPTPIPDLPEPITQAIDQVVAAEQQTLMEAGTIVDPQMLAQRRQQLMDAAFRAGLKRAKREAKKTEDQLDDILREGGFYRALVEFLVDLPIFCYAVIKGPVVHNVTDIKWVNGQMQEQTFPRMHWYRVSPFDVYFSPGATCPEDTEVIERIRLRRAELNSLIGVPGYNEEAIRRILDEYPQGFSEHIESGDSERADMEGREDPVHDTGWYDSLEFHGSVQGRELLDYGMAPDKISDPTLDYFVTAWLIGREVIKVQLNPNPRKRHPYYITSYEKVPGSIYGNSLNDIIYDIQEVGNSAFRSLVNNMSIASGPQVAINEDRLTANTDGNSLYPWKRWRFHSDPLQTSAAEKPIDFFQPQSNATELLGVYKQMSELADEISAIPRYITGNEKVGGAARTASGLSMLMSNASKVLQMVAANVDGDVLRPVLDVLYDTIMLTDKSGMLRGDENIVVKGVSMAVQKESDRMRRLEFLQITNNPIDAQIITPRHRAAIHRHLAEDLGMPEDDVVPTEEEIEQAMMQAAQAAQVMQAAGQAEGDQPKAPGNAPTRGLGEQTDNAFRTRGT